MKLIELENLKELHRIPNTSYIPSSLMYDSTTVHIVDERLGETIYVCVNAEEAVYCIFDDLTKPAIAYFAISLDDIVIHDTTYNQIKSLYVDSNRRGKSLSILLHQTAIDRYKLNLMSDLMVTTAGEASLKKIVDKNLFRITYYNVKTKQYSEQNPGVWNTMSDWIILMTTINYTKPTNTITEALKKKYTKLLISPYAFIYDDIA